MPFFVGALNALYSFQFYWVRLWVVLLGAKIAKILQGIASMVNFCTFAVRFQH